MQGAQSIENEKIKKNILYERWVYRLSEDQYGSDPANQISQITQHIQTKNLLPRYPTLINVFIYHYLGFPAHLGRSMTQPQRRGPQTRPRLFGHGPIQQRCVHVNL